MSCELFDPAFSQVPVAAEIGEETYIISSRPPLPGERLPVVSEVCLIDQAMNGEQTGQDFLCEGCGHCAHCQFTITTITEEEWQVDSLRRR